MSRRNPWAGFNWKSSLISLLVVVGMLCSAALTTRGLVQSLCVLSAAMSLAGTCFDHIEGRRQRELALILTILRDLQARTPKAADPGA